jgi:hypothetical protein
MEKIKKYFNKTCTAFKWPVQHWTISISNRFNNDLILIFLLACYFYPVINSKLEII